MSRLELFDSGLGLSLVKQGLISIDWLVKYNTYKVYTEFTDVGIARPRAIEKTAIKCNCDESSVARYIYAFERDDPFFNAKACKKSKV
jgi:hypothetical protein